MNDSSQKNAYPAFKPPLWLRPAMVQTFLASQKFRKRGRHAMEAVAETVVLDCADGVKLTGSYSAHPDHKALLILLHGWEGSENSTYVMSNARYFYDRGVSVFRLNFRDHGDTHSLNEAPFHSARFDEVFEGVQQAALRATGTPTYIAGFSLGGNFALRIAAALKTAPIQNLAHIFAISPVIDPLKAAPLVDYNPLVRRYFYKKWTLSLRKKQAAFPDLYDFSELETIKTVMDMTRVFLPKYTEFQTLESYFNAYKIWPDDLLGCPVDVSLIMAKDDPVIPAEDMLTLNLPENALSILHSRGGHNGFFQSLSGPTWYDEYMADVILDS